MEKNIVYFEKAGKVNTEKTLLLAKERAEELGIKTVVLASSSGFTAQMALEVFKNTDLKLVVVGISKPRFSSELLKTLENRGIAVRFSSVVEYSYLELMRNAFYKFSGGMKVVMDLGMILSAENLVSENEEVVAIAGTGHRGFVNEGGGADTAVVLVPRISEQFNSLPENKANRRDIKEIICKPR